MEGVEEAMICSTKIQLENVEMTWNSSLITFCMIFKFPKFDGFKIL